MINPALLTRRPVLAYSARAAANSADGFSSPIRSRRTAPQALRLFCARVMAGCAWEAARPAGFLDTGLLTRAQLATLRLAALVANSKTKIKEFHHD